MVNGVIYDLYTHSVYCVPDNSEELVARFKEALAEALSRHWYRLKPLYDSLAAVHAEAAILKPYQSLRSFMKKNRRRRYPPNPENIPQFIEQLLDPRNEGLLEYDTGRLTVQLITDENGANHALFFDHDFIRDEISDVNKLLIDATFSSRPSIQGAYQLLTIMGIKFNHGFPFAWIIMSGKTQAAYLATLRYVKERVLTSNVITLVMTDFERGLRNAITAVFTTAHCTGCNTHYDRAIYRKAKALGLGNRIQTDAEAKDFFKKTLALAYLPAQLVDTQYHRLWTNLSAATKQRFSGFNRYYCRSWLRTVTPSGFSVYGLSRRTNNIIESYHSRLGQRMESRPSAWDFLCKLLKLQTDVRNDIRRLRNNGQISKHARYSTIFKQRQLMKAWRELHFRDITVTEFLEKAAALKGNVAALIDEERLDGINDDEMVEPSAPIPLEYDPDYERELFADDGLDWLANVAEDTEEFPDNDNDSDDGMSGESSDESVIEMENPTGHIQQNAVPIETAARQSPPPEEIPEVASMHADNTSADGESLLSIWSPTGSANPTLEEGGARVSQRDASPVDSATERNRRRNKRRKVMRRIAKARLRERAAENGEAHQLRSELAEARIALQAAENIAVRRSATMATRGTFIAVVGCSIVLNFFGILATSVINDHPHYSDFYRDIDLPKNHMKYYFNSFPKIAERCRNDSTCPYKNELDKRACWGYEADCKLENAFSVPHCPGDHKGWVSTKRAQIETFYAQGDFGYVRDQRKEMMVLCEPLFLDDSSFECTEHLRFCRGRNIMINFTDLAHRNEPIRYKMDVLKEGQIGGYCTLKEQRLTDNADHISALQSWGPEVRNFRKLARRPIVDGDCDVVIEKPTYMMKIDATVNLYHHFCDFFNLYASLHVNLSHPSAFTTDNHVMIWESYSYRSAFQDTFEAFTRNPLWDLKTFRGKTVCFRNLVLPLLPRMIFGLYYNTPLIYGCEKSGLFKAFSEHLLHRLRIPLHKRKSPRIRVTLLSRETKYRKILNEDELVDALKENPEYRVQKVVYNRDMSFKKQLETTRNTDIFIGIHGAGLTHAMFLPDWAAMFELYNCEDASCYKDLARLRGVKYFTWENDEKLVQQDPGTHPDGGAHAKFTNYSFDVDEFVRIVSKAANHVRSNEKFRNFVDRKGKNAKAKVNDEATGKDEL